MSKKRPITGLHRNYTEPCLLIDLLRNLRPSQVQMNQGRMIQRGFLADSPTVDSISKTITIELEMLYEGEYPENKNSLVRWREVPVKSITPLLSTNRQRIGIKWSNNNTYSTLTPRLHVLTFPFNHFYLTRDERIKVVGTCDHLRFFRKFTKRTDDFWRFFGSNDATNLYIDPTTGKVSQKKTII